MTLGAWSGDWAALAPPLAAGAAGAVLLGLERRGRSGLGPLAAVLALAFLLVSVGGFTPTRAPLTLGLIVAVLARDRDELLHGECALKLLWVLGAALALSWAGLELLTLATGTSYVIEQWGVLQLGLEPRFLWSTALPLSLLVGLVLLGGAPFHFWVADVLQGVRPWLAPLAVAALQATGAMWLAHRLEGIERFPAGALLAFGLLRVAAMVSFVGGAATLLVQRRPERRVGTLASLQGAMALAALANRHGFDETRAALWAAHLAVALAGASTLARFLPASSNQPSLGAPLLRRHPLAAALGLFALLSLAGFPGTPGAIFWLDTARALLSDGATTTLLALGAAWLVGLFTVLKQIREAIGIPGSPEAETRAVPWPARAALWLAALGMAPLVVAVVRGR